MRSSILTRSASFQTPSQLFIGSGAFSLRRSRRIVSLSPRCALPTPMENPLRRARSDADLIVPDRILSPPAMLPEEDEGDVSDREISGGGRGRGIKVGGGRGGGGGDENDRMESYYQEMLQSDPSNPLLLRNYGRFLHEEGDAKGAEECYSRAILMSPGDGDVLSLYGKLVWEADRDEERAGSYFKLAVEASPDDCYVLGSYASFLWDAEEEEEEAAEGAKVLVEAV